ncbi:MAG: hypothetical protein FJ303_04045 [Planctomycetes bacterium]|nr:hypothetical protein [Planctomycetota bacterium]
MKRRRERAEEMRVLRLWDWDEVTKALPYFHSVIGSLREHWLELRNAECRLERRPDVVASSRRQEMIDETSRQDERRRAEEKFEDALGELNALDVYLLDPIGGFVLIPFRNKDELAWYVFDHFAKDGVIGWRYHQDPIDQCRPLDDAMIGPATPS